MIFFKRLLVWTPRGFGILYALFLSLFALDVFDERQDLFTAILGFLIHLVPTYLIVITLIVAWKWEWIGSIIFTALALFYIFSSKGQAWIISGPLFLLGFLFLLSWVFKTEPGTP